MDKFSYNLIYLHLVKDLQLIQVYQYHVLVVLLKLKLLNKYLEQLKLNLQTIVNYKHLLNLVRI